MDKVFIKFIENKLKNISWGSIKVNFNNHFEKIFQGKIKGLNSDIIINDTSLYKDILFKGELGFAEGYINNKWKTNNLGNLLKVLLQNQKLNTYTIKQSFFNNIIEKINFFLKKNSISQAKKNITFHYDLGNDFYSKWLDETMTYSSALYKNDINSLKNAQINKYQNIINNLEIAETDAICEIGTGWGGFAGEIKKKFQNINYDGYTISNKQLEFINNKFPNNSKNFNFHFLDYRNIKKTFNKIISIEMFEAVGEKYWDVYFKKISDSLLDNGKVCLQIITINENSFSNYINNVDFIQKYIFPGGVLPTKSILENLFKKHKLKLYQQEDFGLDYSKTLMEWKKNFNNNWDKIENTKFDKKFKNIWNYYFDYCETGFSLKHTDVSQFYLKKVA